MPCTIIVYPAYPLLGWWCQDGQRSGTTNHTCLTPFLSRPPRHRPSRFTSSSPAPERERQQRIWTAGCVERYVGSATVASNVIVTVLGKLPMLCCAHRMRMLRTRGGGSGQCNSVIPSPSYASCTTTTSLSVSAAAPRVRPPGHPRPRRNSEIRGSP